MPRPAKKKGAIERSALELFAERGIDGTSIRMIAERAGVTEGALYRHHASKDDLVRSLFFQYFEAFAHLMEKAEGENDDIDSVIGAMVTGFFKAFDDDPKGFTFVILVQHQLLEGVRSDMGNPIVVLMRVIERAIARGEIKKCNVALKAQLLMGMVMQAAVGKRYGRLTGTLRSHAGPVSAAAVAALRA